MQDRADPRRGAALDLVLGGLPLSPLGQVEFGGHELVLARSVLVLTIVLSAAEEVLAATGVHAQPPGPDQVQGT